MSVALITKTTLTAAISATARALPVSSNTSHTVGQYIVLAGGEICLVQSLLGTTITNVERGQQGTKAQAWPTATLVYGSLTALGPTEYTPFGGRAITLPDVPPAGLPNYRLPLGSRARDVLGNEFVFCDFNSTVSLGQPVLIHSAGIFIADALATTGRGPIGIVAEPGASTSDQWGWVQVYGRAMVQLGNSGSSPSDAANGPTTLNTSVATVFVLGTSLSSPNGVGWVSDALGSVSTNNGRYVIDGMAVASDVSLGNVSAVTQVSGGFSHTGNQVGVMLNYPSLRYLTDSSSTI